MTQGLCFPESSAVTFLGNKKKVCGDPEVRWLDRWDLLPPDDNPQDTQHRDDPTGCPLTSRSTQRHVCARTRRGRMRK